MKKSGLSLLTASAMLASMLCVPGTVLAEEADTVTAGVVVEENADSATGYTVSFTYIDEEATNVQIMGGFQFYVKDDENVYANGYNLDEDDAVANYLVDPEDWTSDANLCHVFDASYIADMENEDGVWTFSLDLTGGSYLYQYNVSYDNGETYESIIDPANIPYCNELGAEQTRSQFYVPYDAEKQSENDDWTWLTPAEDEADRGTLIHTTYIGAEGTEREVEIYLPADYDADREEPYKVLYLSHGGGGEEGDWFYQGNAGNIVDRLTADGVCESFIMVAMDNSVLEVEFDVLHEDTAEYLIPFIEENYNVSTEAEGRAYAGLSRGARITTDLYLGDPTLFGYYGIFSGSDAGQFPELDDYSDYAVPTMYLAAGWVDQALMRDTYLTDEDNTTLGMAAKLDELGITYNNGEGVYVVDGGHDWFTWPQILKNFVETTLWQ